MTNKESIRRELLNLIDQDVVLIDALLDISRRGDYLASGAVVRAITERRAELDKKISILERELSVGEEAR